MGRGDRSSQCIHALISSHRQQMIMMLANDASLKGCRSEVSCYWDKEGGSGGGVLDLEGRGGTVGQQVHEHGLPYPDPAMHVQPLQLGLLRLGWCPCHQASEPACPSMPSVFAMSMTFVNSRRASRCKFWMVTGHMFFGVD